MTTPLIFGKYEIQHRIAIGGMGEVFYAIQRGVSGFERPVILKSLLPDLAQQKDLVEQFLDEARVAATLNHPNVVSIFEVGLWNGTFYIAMEYIRGRNLAQLIRRSLEQQQRIPPPVAARIIRDAALGLDHAHHAVDSSGQPLRIIHRDVSPQNIMLREDGVTKVVDFGIARAANRSTRTATGLLKGKLAYMAPEQVDSNEVSPLVDQYALGVVFWEMLTSKRLFRSDNDLELVRMVLEANVARPETLAPDVPVTLADVAMRMISRKPVARYASLGEVVEALEPLLTAQTPSLTPAALMRRLGTDDLRVANAPTATGGNFVITLQAGNQGNETLPSVDVDLSTRLSMATPGPAVVTADGADKTGVLTTPARGPVAAEPYRPPPSPFPKSLAAVVALAVVAVGGWWFLSARQVGAVSSPVVDAGPIALEPPPPPPRVEPPIDAPDAMGAGVEIVAPAKLRLESNPPGAALRLDGRPIGRAPQEVELDPDKPHYLQAELPRHERLEQEITLPPGESRKVTLELKALRAPVRPEPAVPLERGELSIDTKPWTVVTLDGVSLGSTPILRHSIAAGDHELSFSNPELGIRAKERITVKPGEKKKVQRALQP